MKSYLLKRFATTYSQVFRLLLALLLLQLPVGRLQAQVGEYRNTLAFGVNGGYILSNVNFLPKVPQGMLGGITGGVTIRYTSEKYFNSICAIVAELNYSQVGWKEDILTIADQPVINHVTRLPAEYSRKMTYLQLPVFARMGWGREQRGFQFFAQVGPQLGYFLSESTEANFDVNNPNMLERTSSVTRHYEMPVENKLDYGIAGGLGLEFSNRHIGHILVEGRYYYGLGNLYGNSKRDYFAISNFQQITVKMTYLFDFMKTKNPNIK